MLGRINKGNIKKLNWDNKMVCTSEQWPDEYNLRSKLLTYDSGQVIENSILVSIVDIPEIHCFQEKNGDRFFNSLSNVNSLDLFSNTVIKAIIDYKWPLIRRYIVRLQFIPFLIYLAVFIVFSNALCG